MSTQPPHVDPSAIVTGAAGKIIDPLQRGVDAVVFRATGYKMPWFTPAQVILMLGPVAYSAASAIQTLVQHHAFRLTNLWELLASTGAVGALRLGSYLLKVLDPAVQPTEVAAVPVSAVSGVVVPVTPPPA